MFLIIQLNNFLIICRMASQYDLLYYICLLLILFISCFFCGIIILIMLHHIKQLINSSKSYYGIIMFLLAAKLTIYLVYGLKYQIAVKQNLNTNLTYTYFTQIYYVNLLFVINFGYTILITIICKKYLIFCYNTVVNRINKKLSKFILAYQIINIILSFTIITLYNILGTPSARNQRVESLVNYLSAIQNFFADFCIIFTQFYMNIILTGTLVQSQAEQCLKHLKKIQLCFFISRAAQGVYYLFEGSALIPYFQYILNKDQIINSPATILLSSILYIALIFITQCLPIIISINLKTIKILGDAYSKNYKPSLLMNQQPGYIKILEGSDRNQKSQEIKMSQFKESSLLSNTMTGFGIVMKVVFHEKLLVARSIEIQLSKYLIEEIGKQIQQRKRNKIPSLANIKFSLIQPTKICFISEYLPYNLNLYLIHHKNLSINKKLKIAFKISQCIQEIHKLNLPHGSLKFNNIFIQNDECKLGDHGLLSLKKFINLTKGYSNKSFYTAPEFLSQKSGIVNKPTKEGDIYSFGMIMFEFFTEITDYRTLNTKQAQKSFKEQETRPKIPQNVPNYISNLIRSCWQQLPSQRPSIQEIRGILRQYSKS